MGQHRITIAVSETVSGFMAVSSRDQTDHQYEQHSFRFKTGYFP